MCPQKAIQHAMMIIIIIEKMPKISIKCIGVVIITVVGMVKYKLCSYDKR